MSDDATRQLFDLLREQKATLARIETMMEVHNKQIEEHNASLECLKLKDARRSGAITAIGALGGAIGAAVTWLVKQLIGGGQ